MGKTFKSFDKSERLDYHDGVDADRRRKYKKGQIARDIVQHSDRKTDQFNKLAPGDGVYVGDDD